MIDSQFSQKILQDFRDFNGFSTKSPYHEQNINERTIDIYETQFKILGSLCNEIIDIAAPPGLVTDAIIHALTSRFPKSTYYVGMDAKILASLNWLLGERVMDAIQAKVFGY